MAVYYPLSLLKGLPGLHVVPQVRCELTLSNFLKIRPLLWATGAYWCNGTELNRQGPGGRFVYSEGSLPMLNRCILL